MSEETKVERETATSTNESSSLTTGTESQAVARKADELATTTEKDIERRLASEEVVVSAPFSYHGSAARIWKITRASDETAYRIALITCALVAVLLAWVLVTGWYLIFGLLLVPYRLIRRSSRKKKMDDKRQHELLDAMNKRQ